jgi:iron complex outermembrane receptor protein
MRYSIRIFLPVVFFFLSVCSWAQSNLNVIVADSITQERLPGVTLVLKGTSTVGITDREGSATVSGIPDGNQTFLLNLAGYRSKEISWEFPTDSNQPFKIYLAPSESQLDEIVIEATRANKSVADLPTRTEVLTEEIDEAASMEPGKIAHLITHSTGIQVQTTSATSNGAVVRIQGLNGRYTQILKDGFPLYGGFSGSLDILQIPPLDLRQVEYIKGPASTMYGGGAIAGLVNLLTKRATQDETLLHINLSHIGARDFNVFVAKKFGVFGFTNLASLHMHSPYDADNDGYTDVPDVLKFNYNPKLFYFPDQKTEIYLGANISAENRMGGDTKIIENQLPDSTNFYYDKQKSGRITTQFSALRKFNPENSIILKNSYNSFNRHIEIRENIQGDLVRFGGRQQNTFTEFGYNLNKKKHNLTIGLNAYTDYFKEQVMDTNRLRNQEYLTMGSFVNYLWDINSKLSIESGLRADYVIATSQISKSDGEAFVLPRISALYRLNSNFSIRSGGGMGYRMPTLFNEEAEPFGYKNIQPINFNGIRAERSYGGNIDFKFQSTFGSQNILFTLNPGQTHLTF